MLKIIKGPSGSGKTQYIYEKAAEMVGEQLYFIVPEQDTVNAENLLLTKLGNTANLTAETFNFSRLPNRVFRETGGLAHAGLDRAGKNLRMAASIEAVAKGLCEYADVYEDTGFILKAASTIDELKNAGVFPGDLEEMAKDTDSPRLKGKLQDLSLIYSAYKELSGKGADSSDDLMRLADVLEEYDFFADSIVFIDGFYDYTKPQYDIIYRILYSAKEVYITSLCRFEKSERALERIIALAARCECEYEIISLEECKRTTGTLAALGESFFEDTVCSDLPEDIIITECPTIYDECTAAARQIRRLTEEGVKCSQIAICARGVDAYSGIIEEIFKDYGIPLHFESREDITYRPLIGYLLASLEVIESGWRLSYVKKLLKTALTDISADDILLLENYADFWNISGSLWYEKKDWTMNPSGYTDRLSEWDSEVLERVNFARKVLTQPILKLAEELGAPSLTEKLTAIYRYLKDTAYEKICGKISDLRAEGKFIQANAETQIWNFAMNALDQLKLAFPDANIGRRKLIGYLKLIFSEYDMGTLPTSVDEVIMGEAAFMRPFMIKYLFLLGVNEGVFPAPAANDSLLSDKDKKWMTQRGTLLSTRYDTALDEEFYFYLAVTRPSDGLYLSYHTSNLSDAKAAKPSVFIERIKKTFPNIETGIFNSENLIPMTREELFSLFLARDDVRKSMSSLFPLEASRALFAKETFANLERRGVIEGGISGDIRMTQAKFDSYKNCKYSYFLRYMLSLKEKKKADFSYSETGTFIHKLLEDLMSKTYNSGIDITTLTDAQLKELIDESAREYIKTSIPIISEESVRFRRLMERICKFLTLVIENIIAEFSQSSFRPLICEAKIGEDIKAYKIPLDDGSHMIFTGSIDRVDIYRSKSGKSYIRVVDYKTSSGGKKFSLSDVQKGLNVQMLVYLFAAMSGIKGKSDNTVPAGVIYVPAAAPAIVSDLPLTKEEIADKAQGDLKRFGLILDEEEIIYAMEQSGDGRFIPARIGKNGLPLASSSLATLEQFGKLKTYLDKMFRETAKQLQRGEIDVDPFCRGKNSCEYCAFGPICRFEGRGRTYETISTKEFWERVEKEDSLRQ